MRATKSCLRYSLVPLEKVLSIRINKSISHIYYIRVDKSYDSRKKCLDELVLTGGKLMPKWYIKVLLVCKQQATLSKSGKISLNLLVLSH